MRRAKGQEFITKRIFASGSVRLMLTTPLNVPSPNFARRGIFD
jgi:hypothetical protein